MGVDASSGEVGQVGQAGQVGEVGQVGYTTPRWVQVWFLRRSRDNWKRKYMRLKAEAKRLRNRVNDVTKSRESWRRQVRDLEAENAALRGAAPDAAPDAAPREQAALKKGGPRDREPVR